MGYMLSQQVSRVIFRYSSSKVGRCSTIPSSTFLHAVSSTILVPLTPCPTSRRQSSSSTRWKSRQSNDSFSREARVRGLKSRAAFKLLEIDLKYRLFKRGQTVVDLGYAPGSWSQVAVERTKPNGRIIGIDIIPAQPPKGVSTIQGNFLDPGVQGELKRFLSDSDRGCARRKLFSCEESDRVFDVFSPVLERYGGEFDHDGSAGEHGVGLRSQLLRTEGTMKAQSHRVVDIVLSDMSAPWEQTIGFWKRTLSDPYVRMMNTSGINFKDHAGSMDLCSAAIDFAEGSLRAGGHFVCKFYQGSEDREVERKLKAMFKTVHREKPASSRTESKEAFFVALKRKEIC